MHVDLIMRELVGLNARVLMHKYLQAWKYKYLADTDLLRACPTQSSITTHAHTRHIYIT
jgi:hypothetical protein